MKRLKQQIDENASALDKLEIVNSSRIAKSQLLYPIRKMIEWVFLDECKNPLWIRLSVSLRTDWF